LNQPIVRQKGQLIRGIGLVGGALLVVNGMIGSGIFALPSAIAARAGILSPWLFLAAGGLIITVVLTFAEISSYFRKSGGPALYAAEAFGPRVGFATGWIYFVSRAASFAANSRVLAIYLGTLSPWFSTDAGQIIIVVVLCALLTLVNIFGVKSGVRTLVFLTFFKLVPLVVMILLGLQYVSPDFLLPANLPTIDDLGGTTLLLIYAFIGFEQVVVPAGEISNPGKTIPKALVLTVIATGVFYFLIVLVYISVLAEDVAESATLVDVGRKLAGPFGALAITITAIFSIGGNLSSTILAVPRLTQSLADNRLLPQWFGKISERFSTPANSIAFFGGISAALAVSGTFARLAIAASLARLVVYVICIAALPAIKRRAAPTTIERAFQIKGGYSIPLVALGLCLWMISFSSAETSKAERHECLGRCNVWGRKVLT